MESVMGQAIVFTVVGDTEAIIDIVHFLLPTSHSIDCNYLRQYLCLCLRIINHGYCIFVLASEAHCHLLLNSKVLGIHGNLQALCTQISVFCTQHKLHLLVIMSCLYQYSNYSNYLLV